MKDEILAKLNKYAQKHHRFGRLADLKQYNLFVSELYSDLGFSKHAERLLNCGYFVNLIADRLGKHPMAIKSYRCHDRFCPLCSRIKSIQLTRILETLINYLISLKTKSGNRKYTFTFLTPTIPNVKPVFNNYGRLNVKKTARFIRASYKINNLACKKLMNLPTLNGFGSRRVVRRGHYRWLNNNGRILGYMSKHEITVNHNLSINVHNHLITIMHGSYYKGKYYLSQKKWRELWNKTVASVCEYVINSKSKYFGSVDRVEASNVLKVQKNYKSKGGLVLDIEAPYFKKLMGVYKNGKPHFKKITMSGGNSGRVVHHLSVEMAKYQAKAQDLRNMLKNGIPKNKVVSVFGALYYGLLNTHYVGYYGLFARIYDKYNKGLLDKYTPQAKKGIYYDLSVILKYIIKSKYYQEHYKRLSDKQKLYIRYRYHVPTTYTTDEKHMNFDTKHDKKLLDEAVLENNPQHVKDKNYWKGLKYRLAGLDGYKLLYQRHCINNLLYYCGHYEFKDSSYVRYLLKNDDKVIRLVYHPTSDRFYKFIREYNKYNEPSLND